MRVTYGRSLYVQNALRGDATAKAAGTETFLPVTERVDLVGARRVKRLVPAISNLIFVLATKAWMQQFKASTMLPVRYFMDAVTGKPLTVPDQQMRQFIAIASHTDPAAGVEFIDPSLSALQRGAMVRVTGGIFAGAEGRFVRLRGDRRVVVSIPGVAAVATHFIHPSLVEVIEN